MVTPTSQGNKVLKERNSDIRRYCFFYFNTFRSTNTKTSPYTGGSSDRRMNKTPPNAIPKSASNYRNLRNKEISPLEDSK